MKSSFRNFMTGLIDYAGFFPPAGLDIKTAVDNYLRYLVDKEGWMLGRCIVPAAELHHIMPPPGLRCSVILSPGIPQEELHQLSRFMNLSSSGNQVEMVETRLPETVRSSESCSDYLLQVKSGLLQAGLRDVHVFIEAGSIASAASVAPVIAAFNSSRSGGKIIADVGYKLRCGGLNIQAFSTPAEVAEVISICRGQEIPIKFTAGMHNPFYNYSSDMEVMQHGFINIFSAALLSWSCNLSIPEIAECLGDKTANHFHFAEQQLSWKENLILASEIKRLRQRKVVSFGSCSFTEPVEGLRSLGVLGA